MASAGRTQDREQPLLAVAAVARRLGVAPATLRTWDRRYGLGPSDHAAGAHRRYTAVDVDRLMVMRRLTAGGVAPADAAAAALDGDPSAVDQFFGAARTPKAVVEAALDADMQRLEGLLRIDGQDVIAWWTDLVVPAREQLALHTELDPPGQDADLLVQMAVCAAIRDRMTAVAAHPSGVVLLLSPPGEARPLLLHAVAAAVGGVDARMVSGPMSARHLVDLVMMTRARAVVTVADRRDADMSLVEALISERPDLPQFVLVPTEDFARVPTGPEVQRARSVAGLVHELRAALTVQDEEV
ncbi:MAG: MerR family transcriptional regulator [Micrococcales bacterium]|nr:MerR family transcriptional regulator [Micrococcales bacterium]MCL2666914.1 MerR family transcriptional regulator [Micrococcales bacterium]